MTSNGGQRKITPHPWVLEWGLGKQGTLRSQGGDLGVRWGGEV